MCPSIATRQSTTYAAWRHLDCERWQVVLRQALHNGSRRNQPAPMAQTHLRCPAHGADDGLIPPGPACPGALGGWRRAPIRIFGAVARRRARAGATLLQGIVGAIEHAARAGTARN